MLNAELTDDIIKTYTINGNTTRHAKDACKTQKETITVKLTR